MDTLHTLLGAALGVSFVVNMVQSQLHQHARQETAFWQRAARANQTALLDALDQYHELRTNSHRRDPETGRLLPKGE